MGRTQKTSGESNTLPTVLIFVLNKKSAPIFCMISDHPVNINNVFGKGDESTFMWHTDFAGFGYNFRDIFRFLDRV